MAVVEFDARQLNASSPRAAGPGYGNLRSAANFALLLDELLPGAERVVYLDADSIIVRDIATLRLEAGGRRRRVPRPGPATTPRTSGRACFFVITRFGGVRRPRACQCATPVFFIDLKRWRLEARRRLSK